jgi:hypothetical protein
MVRSAILLALAFAVGALAELVQSVPGHAQSTAGIELTGTQDAGGVVHLTLSPSGDQITAFDVDGVAGGGCSWDVIDLSNWGGPISVTDGHFEATNADGDVLAGQIVAPNRVEGTILVHDPVKGCETPPLHWVASAPD